MQSTRSVRAATEPLLRLIEQNTELAALVVAFVASWALYGIVGKRMLGADDDYWEGIRARLIPILQRFSKGTDLYAVTKTRRAEYAGLVQMQEDEFERKLKEAGYLRQPLASLHKNERGWTEDGSWSRTHGMLLPVKIFVTKIPGAGRIVRRWLSALDTIFARRQTHIIFYTEQREDGTYIHVYSHDEPNPINPLTAYQHYEAIGFHPDPAGARASLKRVGVTLRDAKS